MPYNILILGAAYGSLLGSKMLFGGHYVNHVCLPAEADLINSEGFRVRLPVKGRKDPVVLDTRNLPGKVSACGPKEVNPKDYDLIGLAMQEPQYRSPGVRELLDAVAKSRVPTMSIMNMPPLPYVKRIPGLDYEALKPAYTDADRVGQFRSGLRSRCAAPTRRRSVRRTSKVNVLMVTLPTNFKVAKFDNEKGNVILRQLEAGDRRDPLRSGRRHQDRAAGEAARARLAVRAARQMVDAARRQLSLRDRGRHAHRAGGRALRHRDLALGLQFRVRPVRQARRQSRAISCRSRNMPPPRNR